MSSEENSNGANSGESNSELAGKYNEPCALCGKAPCDKHFASQFFHKKCFRKVKKGARGMI